MKKLIMAGMLLSPVFATQALADNIAACEVVLMEKVEADGEKTEAEIASFRPGAAFISSVYDDDQDIVREIDGHKIRGVMCQRNNVIPTLRDFPIVKTGLPLSLSQNFDSAESALVTIYYKDGMFQNLYSGPELDEKKAAALKDVLEIYNLQSHDLPK